MQWAINLALSFSDFTIRSGFINDLLHGIVAVGSTGVVNPNLRLWLGTELVFAHFRKF